jgi:AraC family transcriptional regulator, transcriptional activator of pobA
MAQSRKNLYKSNMRTAADILLEKGLFGESTQLPDVMHCETIAARSSLHDWELAPHRHAHLHQVMLVQSGSGMAHIEGRQIPFGDGALMNVPPGVVHAFRFLPDTQGFVVTLADEILDLILAGAGDVRHTLSQPSVCAAPADMAVLMQQIWSEFNGMADARALMLRGLCSALLGLVVRQLVQTGARPAEQDKGQVLQRFEALLQVHLLEHWGVAEYARALSVSPTHLSRVVRAATGAPASQLINARIIREARQRLAYTNLRVSTIAYTLGFADPAHFSRVFTRDTGLSPRAFRRMLSR